jgi:hypothetical protein
MVTCHDCVSSAVHVRTSSPRFGVRVLISQGLGVTCDRYHTVAIGHVNQPHTHGGTSGTPKLGSCDNRTNDAAI